MTLVDWRLIFFINVPVGMVALLLLARTPPSERRPAPLDPIGQVTGVLAMGGLTFGAIEAGFLGFTDSAVVAAFVVAVVSLIAFIRSQHVVAHPMLPLELFRRAPSRSSQRPVAAFMVGYFGLPFVVSLFVQQHLGLDALHTGVCSCR